MPKLIVGVIAVCVLACIGWLWQRDVRLGQRDAKLDALTTEVRELTRAVRALVEDKHMEPGHQYAIWFSGSPPVERIVDTKRNVGESESDWTARHNAAVATAKALYPPV